MYSAPLTDYPELICEAEATLLLVHFQAKDGPPIDSSASLGRRSWTGVCVSFSSASALPKLLSVLTRPAVHPKIHF